jgi:hypothetical protein
MTTKLKFRFLSTYLNLVPITVSNSGKQLEVTVNFQTFASL